jgi:hypothetical protein
VGDAEGRALRPLHEAHLDFGERHQRALAAADDLGEVAPVLHRLEVGVAVDAGARFGEGFLRKRLLGEQVLEAVAAVAPPVARGVAGDGRFALREQRADLAVEPALGPVALIGRAPFLLRERAEGHGRPVGQEAAQGAHVVDHVAVEDRVRPGGVVGNHAAEGGAVRRRGVGAHHEAVLGGRAVEVVQHDARFDARGPRLGIDVDDLAHVAREVDHQRRPDGLPGQCRAAAAREHRHVEALAGPEGGLHVGARPGQEHGDGRDLVHARVGGVKRARHLVGAQVAFDALGERVGEVAVVRGQRLGRRRRGGAAGRRGA